MNSYLTVLQKSFTFQGRARRKEYWLFILFNYIVLIGFSLVGNLFEMPLLSTIYSLIMFIPSISAIVRRMHDVGRSGWFSLIPIYNIILACTPGDQGDNGYGTDPKATEVLSAENLQ